MTKSYRGSARVIDGVQYVLALDFNMLCDLSRDHPQIMKGEFSEEMLADPVHFRSIFHRGLIDQLDTDLDAGDLISAITINGAGEWLGEALSVAFGVNEGQPVNPRKPQPQTSNGTGAKSSPSGWNWAAIQNRFGLRRQPPTQPS